ncbi:hypothetical protein Q1695_013136 [Nippostrongylus brasiliensis]|nr:hypothetical protein Q1695_013136 [Nippostrongylus brasiliensis]
MECVVWLYVSSRTLDSPHVTKTVSGCVSVVHQPFDLPKLVLRSERCLVILPTMENALDLLLSAIHEELTTCFDACFAVEDISFWTQVAPLIRLENHYEALLPGMVCRVYMREESPWVLTIVVVPASARSLEALDAVPLLFCLCDEPLLAMHLGKRNSPPPERVVDRRFSSSPSAKLNDERKQVVMPPFDFVSTTRCLEVLKENYKPGRLADVISDVDETLISKAVVSALYSAVQNGIAMDHAVVRGILDEQCDCVSLEVSGMANSLSTFCSHLNNEGDKCSKTSYCGESKAQLSFSNILRGTFKQVPGLPYFYYTPQHKESDTRFTGKSELAFFEGLFSDQPVRVGEAATLDRKMSDARAPEDTASLTGSLRRSAADQFRLRSAPNGDKENGRHRNGDDKLAKAHGRSNEYPLFIYFMCSVAYPDGSMDTFPVTFLPTCVKEVLREDHHKSKKFDITRVVVRLYLYIMTWPSDKLKNPHDDTDSDPEEETHSQRQLRFLEKMPRKERLVISELMHRLNRLVELEVVLMDSRRSDITAEKLTKISAYIDHEYTKEKAFKSGQIETRSRRCPLVIQCPEAMDRLKERMDCMHLEYCVLRRVGESNLYYCCQVEDIQAFERYTRQSSGSKNDGIDMSELLRKDQLFDFWVVLHVDETIKLQFCQRENGRHYRIFDLAWRKCRQTIRVVNQELLLNRMFELRECDSLLMTSVQDSIPAQDNILNRSNTSSVSEDQEVDTHISYGVRFTFAPGYFACPLQKKLWFEVHPRLRLPRGSGRDMLAVGCDALRMSLERFAIRNRPNTYVVRESDGNVSYMQLHTSPETFNASLKRNRMNVKKRKEAKSEKVEIERFKSNVLLAVYGVSSPGQEICEVLSDCLQKRLDQVTLSHLIDTLAKNSQTRLDSADVQFLQRNPTAPAGVFNFSIPTAMSQFLQPLSYYTHQHMQAVMPSARYKEDFGSGSTNVNERSVFLPLPFPGEQPKSYTPIFYLLVKSPQEGIRTTGIAAIELRFVTSTGEMASLTTGRLNISTHLSLAPSFDDDEQREAVYREMTHTVRCEELKDLPGVCAYAQVAVWQAGDVDLIHLEDQLQHVVQLGMCDVVTEFGILNLNVIEVGAQLPVSPGLHVSPHSKSTSSAKTPTSTSERRQLRKRDSSDALPVASTPGLPTDSSVRSKGNSVFSFETRRGSFTSELDRISVDYILPANNRSPDYVNPTFVATAGPWFDYVVDRYSGNAPSFITEKGERYTSVLRHSWNFDCKQTISRALREIADHVMDQVRVVDSVYLDRVQIFEPTPRSAEPGIPSSTSSSSSTIKASNRERRYESAVPATQYCMSADIARDPYDCEMPDALLVCQEMQVAIETQRFGFEPVGSCPETLLRLNNSVSKELFLPCTEEGHFVPRRRIMYGTVYGEKLTLYFYNFMPSLSASLMNMVARATSWYNSRARLVREIGLHKMGITHLSPLEYFQSPTDNPYLVLVWRHPDELLDKDYPPDDLQITAIDALPKGYASTLFRLYRKADYHHRLLLNRSPCLIQDQLEQMRCIRKSAREQLNMIREFTTVHESLLSGRNNITESNLEKLRSASKLVHFVETPVLFFPKWRRNIAEVRQVRGAVEHETRKTKIPTGPPLPSLPPGTRQRANTLSVPPSAPLPFRTRSDFDDDDPCQAKILYLLMGDYVAYLSSLGMQLLTVTQLEKRSEERRMYTITYPQGCKHAPYVVMFKSMKGGVLLVTLTFTRPYFACKAFIWHPTGLCEAVSKEDSCMDAVRHIRELQQFKDVIIAQCHLHSFTYDFHLRMLSRYLVGKDKMLFSPGYNTHAFLVDFLEYYGCRPPNARNCVYEERCTYNLQHGVRGGDVWDHFLSCEKAYGWTVLKLKNSEERVTEQRRDDFMLVSSETAASSDGMKEMFRVVLRDRRLERDELHLVFYLIAVSTEQTSPLEEERHREDSRQSEVGEFKNFEKKKEAPNVENAKEVDELIGRANDDDSDENNFSSRRRFSSGGHLQGTTSTTLAINKPTNLVSDAESILNSPRCVEGILKGAESDGDVHRVAVQGSAPRRHRKPACNDDGTIPGEHVTYIHFLSTRQRILQKEVEDAVSQFSSQLSTCVREAEFLCRRASMWKQVLLPKTGRSAQPTTGLSSIFLGSNPNRSLDPWHQLRSVTHHDTMEPSKLKTLISIVSQHYMECREPRLQELLKGSNCARLCRFLFARYGPDRCRFFEFPNSAEKCLILTNPDLDAMFLIECAGETTPTFSVLLKEADLVEDTQDESKLFRQQRLDIAFDDLVACVTAFLWTDLLQKPPGTQ